MNARYQIYFSLLRNALWGTAEEPATIDNDILTLARQQATGTLIAEQILLRSKDSALRLTCKSVCAHSMMAQEEQRHIRQTAVKALQAGGITPVLLKGFALARNYPKPYLRTCSDVDIYVGKENYHKGAAILRDTFPDAPRFETEEEYFRHYNLNVGSTAIEMHRVSASFSHPKDERIYDALEREALQQHFVTYKDAEDEWNEPEPKFNVLFVFIHSWEHFVTESANIRQFCDLALLLHKTKDSALADYLRTNLKKLHLLYAWQLYAYIMVNYLSLPKEKCPLYSEACAKKAEKLMERIVCGAKLPEQRSKTVPKNVFLRKLYTLRERIRKAGEVGSYEPHFARHMVATAFAQSWERFKKGENTRKWE